MFNVGMRLEIVQFTVGTCRCIVRKIGRIAAKKKFGEAMHDNRNVLLLLCTCSQ